MFLRCYLELLAENFGTFSKADILSCWDSAGSDIPKVSDSLKNQSDFGPTTRTKLPDRNAPCVCGSGKKFKKCCMPKLQNL